MRLSMRFVGCAMLLAFVPAVVGAQAKPAETKPAPKPAMQHDMSRMGADTGMKHDMAATGQGKEEMKSGWAELDAFRTLLMSVWHPAHKDSLAMARTLAPTLVASAAAWEKSTGPAACDNAAARKVLSGMVADAKDYADVAAGKANDAGVKTALKKVHDGFETVGKPCMMAAMKGMGGMMGGMPGMMGKQSGWKEFDALHSLLTTVLASSMKGNAMPAREKAVELARLADALAASEGPAPCDNTETRKWIPLVVRNGKALVKAVVGRQADAKVNAAVERTHTELRKVAQPCLMSAAGEDPLFRARMEALNESRVQRNHPAVRKP